jgi:hypothetical protein
MQFKIQHNTGVIIQESDDYLMRVSGGSSVTFLDLTIDYMCVRLLLFYISYMRIWSSN